jgi:hypothetical protein
MLPLEGRPPVPVTVTGVVERPAYRIEKLFYESLPGLFVTANLYIPRDLSEPAPAVLYVCGHAENQKHWYQAHPRRFAEMGFVCLIAETIQLGEVRGYHHGCYSEGWFHWVSRGYTPAGVEAANGIRALDLLAARSDVDAGRLGVTGISGAGPRAGGSRPPTSGCARPRRSAGRPRSGRTSPTGSSTATATACGGPTRTGGIWPTSPRWSPRARCSSRRQTAIR